MNIQEGAYRVLCDGERSKLSGRVFSGGGVVFGEIVAKVVVVAHSHVVCTFAKMLQA